MFKLVALDRLAVYWDSQTEIYSDLAPSSDFLSKMAQHFSFSGDHQHHRHHDFLLAPVSGHAHFKRNCSPKPLRSLSLARLSCNVQLDRVTLEVRDGQYQQLVECCRSLELLKRGLRYRRWRPQEWAASGASGASDGGRKSSKARLWWQFAGRCVASDVRRQRKNRNWQRAVERVRDILSYGKL